MKQLNQYIQNAQKRVEILGIPHRRTESYKYTSLKTELEKYALKPEFNTVSLNLSTLKVEDAYNLFFINGDLSPESDKPAIEISKNIEKSLEIIKANNQALYDDYLYSVNEANSSNLYHFEIQKNQSLDKPIFIFHLNDYTNSMNSYHHTFHIHQGAKLEILEIYLNKDERDLFLNTASSVVVDENAYFTHTHHQGFNHTSLFANNIRAQVAKNANYESFTTTHGAGKSRNNIHIDLNNDGANCTASGIYTLQDSQHCDINSYISHNAPHTESAQLYKGIMNDKSRGVFTGLIKVQRDAQLINSNQLNRNLLLTKGAHANSRPQLEIFADDVKCSHGSTTGQLSDEELFYFESRGIKPGKARMMLARAFTYDVLLKMNNKLIRDYIHADITEKFENKIFGKENV